MISDKAVVETEKIGSNVTIREFAVIRPDVEIGDNVIIHPFVVIESGARLRDNVEVFPGSHIGKTPKGAGATARDPVFENTVEIGSNCSIGPNAVIYYDVKIGNNTLVGDGASIREQCKIGERCIISRHVTINYNAKIGDRTKIMDLTHITGNCEIGSDVFISIHVSTTNDNALGAAGYDESRIQGPRIHDKAMIGAGANILPAVTVGENSIIGAGAVVTKNIPSNKMAIGVPAKIIKDLLRHPTQTS